MKQRICRSCHKPAGDRPLCKTCERVKFHYDKMEELRLAQLREAGWIPPKVETIKRKVVD